MTSLTRTVAVALFLGAALLFLLEPAFGRLVLPRLGGAPAVWNTCLVFFQVTLLGGYLYAWASSRWLGLRAQIGLHAALAVVALVVLPIRIVPGWAPPADASPIPWLLAVLATSIGLPFFVVATTAPVLQHWFSRTDHPDAGDPYFLYQASNLGSMGGLIAYPTLVEPWLGLRAQGIAWSVGYVAFIALLGVCAASVARRVRNWDPPVALPGGRGAGRTAEPAASSTAATEPAPGWPQRIRWTLLAAIPSSLLLGVTTALSTDVAVVPLLWVVPLLLYLASFVLAFARRPLVSLKTATIAHPLIVLPAAVVLALNANDPPWLILPMHLLAFTAIALVCHLRLAAERPHADHLTLFYLCLSVGGALGGLFNALLAPLIFVLPLEYPLAVIAGSLAKPYRDVPEALARPNRRDVVLPALLGVAVAALILGGRLLPAHLVRVEWLLVIGVPAFVCFTFSARPVRFGLGVAVLFMAGLAQAGTLGRATAIERSFFGVHRVVTDASKNLRLLYHGNTMHGVQSLDAARRREPLAYYSRPGPIGQVMAAFDEGRPARVAVVGLGAGAMAAYARPGQHWTFFEIDPAVVALARDSGYFTYLRDALGEIDVVVGDARTTMARLDRQYDLIVLDAFSSDAVPAHLLTREALQLYLARLTPGGILAFHVSNRYVRLRQLFAALSADAGLADLRQLDNVREPTAEWTGRLPSEWILLARARKDFARLTLDDRWAPLSEPRVRVWTDDYSNLLALFRFR